MEVIVSNKIKVLRPTEALVDWCKKNLVIDNPEYYKKERLGKWLGNTPKHIVLYEKVGTDLCLPFGCAKELWRNFGQECVFLPSFPKVEHMDYMSEIKLYPYQKKAVEAIRQRKNGIVVMPCGAGKTQTALEAVAEIGGRTLWLTHTQDLLNQSMNRAKVCFGIDSKTFGTITGGKVDIGSSMTFATVQTLSKLDLNDYRNQWDVIIVDECMPGNTLIDTPTGKKTLKNLCIDDIITSYNRDERKIENKRITHIFKSKAHDIVKVKLSNDEEIICTKNHPIYTKSGQWIDAERLVHDDYVLRLVWKTGRDRYDAKNIQTQSVKKGLLLLFQGMLNKRRSQKKCVDGRTPENCIGNYEQNKSKISRSDCRTHGDKKSDEKCRCTESGIKQAERNRTSSQNKMWKRNGADCATTDVNACACSRECRGLCRVSDTDKDAERFGISNLLQGRYSVNRSNAGNRGRRKLTLCNRKTKTRSEKRAVFEWVRVDSVEIQEQTSDGTFGGMCCDGYVYNIEVENNNNYFANGILVHNCHHAIGSPTRVMQFYKVLSSLCARYKIGLTATPKRADGLERSMFALLGDVICEISKDEVKHTTCPVEVHGVRTGYTPDYDAVLAGDGTLNYAKLVEDLTGNEERFEFVKNIIPHDGAVLVLANRVEYLQKLCDQYEGKAVCLSKLGTSKKAKEIRKEALRKLDSGKIDCIFATWQLAAEGLDCPHLKYVVFATPEKNERTVQQAIGRVGRKAEGKEKGIVIDLLDDFGMYQGWAKKRKNIYKKNEYIYIDID